MKNGPILTRRGSRSKGRERERRERGEREERERREWKAKGNLLVGGQDKERGKKKKGAVRSEIWTFRLSTYPVIYLTLTG